MQYIAIDLKSFYASVECVDRGLNPLTTNLVVADISRTEKTICLAVSPSLKSYGIGGRARLFEVIQRMREVNNARRHAAPYHRFTGKSSSDIELKRNPSLEIDFIIAVPRMAHYIDVSAKIHEIYLKFVAPEDIHTYSIDEVIMDVSDYLKSYKMTARELATAIIHKIKEQTGITATAGIGTNMYLCKVAMDIMAKHTTPDENGVRIAELDEMTYRRHLWNHRPLTDFWRIGRGIAHRLGLYGIDTMGKIARKSIEDEELLYQLFGVNAELLIDHAWGWEPCTMKMVKAYRPASSSISNGQVLPHHYDFAKARVVLKEMAENIALELVEKRSVTDCIMLYVSYDAASLDNPDIDYKGPIATNYFGRTVPKHVNGTATLECFTSSAMIITKAVTELYDKIVNHNLLIHRLNIGAEHVIDENTAKHHSNHYKQLDLFTDYEALVQQEKQQKTLLEKERRLQETQLKIKKRFGKNAILKGLNFQEGATGKERNQQIGGHKA